MIQSSARLSIAEPYESTSSQLFYYLGRRSVWLEDEEWKNIENLLTEEQLQPSEKENGDLAKHYEDTLDQVRYDLINIFSL